MKLKTQRGFTPHQFYIPKGLVDNKYLRNEIKSKPRWPRVGAGFTLIELLVVISILSFLATLAITAVREGRQKGRASEMAADFRNIDTAWRIWQAGAGGNFIHENVYGNTNTEAPCHDEPVLSDTDLFQNVSGTPTWDGPYMGQPPRDPWGRQYSYDNDGDVWNPPGSKWGGVNIQAQWCAGESQRYLELAPLIDNIYDGGDGPDLGKFRWDGGGGQGGYGILIVSVFDE